MIGVRGVDRRGQYLEDENGSGNVLEGEHGCAVKDKFKITTLVSTHKRESAV
jgi:hypothetical protein